MVSILGTLMNWLGWSGVGTSQADPRYLSHISDHPGDMDVTGLNADCGFPFSRVRAGRGAPLCPRCADINQEHPWVQRNRGAGMVTPVSSIANLPAKR